MHVTVLRRVATRARPFAFWIIIVAIGFSAAPRPPRPIDISDARLAAIEVTGPRCSGACKYAKSTILYEDTATTNRKRIHSIRVRGGRADARCQSQDSGIEQWKNAGSLVENGTTGIDAWTTGGSGYYYNCSPDDNGALTTYYPNVEVLDARIVTNYYHQDTNNPSFSFPTAIEFRYSWGDMP